MSDVSLTLQNAAGVYLAITETPAVVTLSAAVISGASGGGEITGTVTANNFLIDGAGDLIQARGYSVGNFGAAAQVVGPDFNGCVSVNGLPAVPISGTVTANTRSYGLANDPWIYIPSLTINVDNYGNFTFDGYYRFNGDNQWGLPDTNYGSCAYIVRSAINDGYEFRLMLHDDNNDVEIECAIATNATADITDSWEEIHSGTLVTGSLAIKTEQRETYSVRVNNSVTIGSLPVQLSTTTIGGTARLNVTLSSATTIGATAPSYGNLYGGSDGTNLRAILVDSSGRTTVTGSVSILGTPSVTIGAISGTVTANLTSVPTHAVTLASTTVTVSLLPALAAGTAQIGSVTASISGTVPVSGTFWQTTQPISGTVTVSSTTVTVSAMPSGALTTRFGSVTTANLAQISTAVTNTSRKYLLAQNISTGTVTIGIGFSPTTTQGIQLTAGAGLTFDSFVPTGAVYWLGATTGAAYTILEG